MYVIDSLALRSAAWERMRSRTSKGRVFIVAAVGVVLVEAISGGAVADKTRGDKEAIKEGSDGRTSLMYCSLCARERVE